MELTLEVCFCQELPKQESDKPDWERIAMLADTITKQEMLTLGCEEMLYRLFNEEKLRLFQQEPVTFKCTCSQKKNRRYPDSFRASGAGIKFTGKKYY